MSSFLTELRELINSRSLEQGSDTPDHILAEYLSGCLAAFDAAVVARERWYGRARPPYFAPASAMPPKPPETETRVAGPAAKQPTIQIPSPVHCFWDLSNVDSKSLLEELRRRRDHQVSFPAENLERVREQARAWVAVMDKLDTVVGRDWRNPNKAPGNAAADAIADLATKAKRLTYEDHEAVHAHTEAWRLVCKALDMAAPGWCNGSGSGQQHAVAAIHGLARGRGDNPGATKFSAREDADRLRKHAAGMTYNASKGEGCLKHVLNEIAMRLDTGGYSAYWRELTPDEAASLACQQIKPAGMQTNPASWVISAIQAASRGEGRQS